MRLDIYLVEKGFCESRSRAARLISEGKIFLDGKKAAKAGQEVSEGEHIVEITEVDRFVGRGGMKLEGALDSFCIDVSGKRCIDVGASTGGFTDCLLQRGAAHVCAVDSGRGQLHQRILEDIRVTNIEGFNARELTPDTFGYFDIAVMDVSFISQTLIHPALRSVMEDGAIFISLIKPQFEAGKSALCKGGIVKKPADRELAIKRVLESAAVCRFESLGVIRSPIEGGDGNIEYLAAFKAVDATSAIPDGKINYKQLCKD